MKWPIGYTFVLHIPFHLLHCWCNTCTNMINNDMIHFISSRDHIGSSILTLLALHRCFGPSAPKSSLNLAFTLATGPSSQVLSLIFSTLITWLHVMSHMQWAPSSHVWALQHLRAISPLWHELLTHMYLWTNHMCISLKHILVHLKLSLNYQNQIRTFHLYK